MSDHLWRERHDLHEPLLAQLAADGPEDAGRAGLPLLGDQHGGVFVKPDVGAVLTLGLFGRAHDDRPHHLALLDLSGGYGVLNRDHDDVAEPGVAALGSAEHADHQRAPRAGVVRDLEYRFLLHHGCLPPLISRARRLRPRASASFSKADGSRRSAPCRPPWRPCRCGPPPAWYGPPACRRTRGRSDG